MDSGSLGPPIPLAYPRPNPATQDGSPHASRTPRHGLLPALPPRPFGWEPLGAARRGLVQSGVRLTRPVKLSSVSQTQSCDSGQLPARLEASPRGPAACPAAADLAGPPPSPSTTRARGLSERACCLCPAAADLGRGAAGRKAPIADPAWSQDHSTCRIL